MWLFLIGDFGCILGQLYCLSESMHEDHAADASDSMMAPEWMVEKEC